MKAFRIGGHRAVAAAGALLLAMSPPVKADHPTILAAGIAATGAIMAAGITATGAILAAAIVASGQPETETEGEGGEGTTSESNGGSAEGGAGGGSSQKVKLDDGGTHPHVTKFIDRQAVLQVNQVEAGGASYVTPVASYSFDGDIMRAGKTIRRFTHNESLLFRLKLDSGRLSNAAECAVLNAEKLRLSTQEVPKTDGYARLRILVVQNGETVDSRELIVRQGKVPAKPAWLGPNGAVFAANLIEIEDFRLPIPCFPDPDGKPIDVTVAMGFEMSGSRN